MSSALRTDKRLSGPLDDGLRGSARAAARLIVGVLAMSALAAGFAGASEPPKGALPLSAVELLKIYGGKTWKWTDGAAYFDLEGRKFRARTVGEAGETTAIGTWRIMDSGKLCFRATWAYATGESQAETCFAHVEQGGDIYQRRLPDGEWYIFKHAKPNPDDEYGKFARGDRINSAATID